MMLGIPVGAEQSAAEQVRRISGTGVGLAVGGGGGAGALPSPSAPQTPSAAAVHAGNNTPRRSSSGAPVAGFAAAAADGAMPAGGLPAGAAGAVVQGSSTASFLAAVMQPLDHVTRAHLVAVLQLMALQGAISFHDPPLQGPCGPPPGLTALLQAYMAQAAAAAGFQQPPTQPPPTQPMQGHRQ
jgi:hypothetical protein